MPPAMLLLRLGSMSRGFVPVPLFLLWPLFLVAWVLVGLAWLITWGMRPRPVLAAVIALQAFGALRGTHVAVRGADGSFSLRFV